MRYAIVTGALDQVEKYLPGNYHALLQRDIPGTVGPHTLIGGEDNRGWTLDDYVLPRLASGIYIGREVSAEGAVNFKLGSPLEVCV